MNNQELYDKACQSLRDHGNLYGTFRDRGWGWVNPKDSRDRCAIAQFVAGQCDFEVRKNLTKLLKNVTIMDNKIICDITHLFDYAPTVCNDKVLLEKHLKEIALKHNLVYKEKTRQLSLA